ncbi:MAG: hypothetical protein GY856_54825 [bacterium]|nr:hypothetical protein [bacterium]
MITNRLDPGSELRTMVPSRIRSPVISGFRGERRRRQGLKAALVCLAYAGLADGKAAREHFDEALRLSRAVGVRAREAMVLRELARIEMSRGNLEQARAYAEPGLELVESLRAEIAAEELRTSFFTFLRESYELYVELMMRMHAQDPTADFAAAAFLAAERARARSLLDLLREARVELRRRPR